MLKQPIVGLHHVTAIASDPQTNLDFYTEVLGLRFVKRTVNFDDPGTYHFYFGDDAGSPGTILTFFPWPHAGRGLAGAGEVTHTAFSVPLSSMGYWEQRLTEKGVLFERSGKRFAEEVLTLPDPDGMKIEIVGHADAGLVKAPRYADVPAEHAIRGFFGVTMLQQDAEETAKILAVMGFRKIAEEGARLRFAADGGALGNHIDIVVDPKANYGRPGAGTVHHIAFRAVDDAAQAEWREEIGQHIPTTEVLDRDYFHSIYFREPGGVLFELATDNPGFAIDEPVESLGEALRVPAWLEPRRAELEQRLAPITLHKAEVGGVSGAAFDPHAAGEVYRADAALEEAAGVVILLHGRGGSAENMLSLHRALGGDKLKLAFLAPQAAGSTWYPNSFLAERESNEPWLSSALAKVQSVVEMAVDAGVTRERIVVGGFSQGACLATEFVATHPARYAGLIAWTGGLIGPLGSDLSHAGELAGTPVFQSSGDPDPHVPWSRVEESARVLMAMGALVTSRRYPGKPHSVSAEEVELARELVEGAFA